MSPTLWGRWLNGLLTDIYGPSQPEDKLAVNGSGHGATSASKKRTVVHLSLSDSLPAYGPINDFTFSLAKNGVSDLYFYRNNQIYDAYRCTLRIVWFPNW